MALVVKVQITDTETPSIAAEATMVVGDDSYSIHRNEFPVSSIVEDLMDSIQHEVEFYEDMR